MNNSFSTMMNFGLNDQIDYSKQAVDNNYNNMFMFDNNPFQQLNQSNMSSLNQAQYTEYAVHSFANDLSSNFLFDSPSNIELNDELLLSLQDLDIPQSKKESYKSHKKKPSGSAIYGFHGKELSIPGLEPIDLIDIRNNIIPESKKVKNTRRLHKLIDPKAIELSKDYIITNNKPTAYKFPSESNPTFTNDRASSDCTSFDGGVTNLQYNMDGIDCILNSTIQKPVWSTNIPNSILPTPTTTASNSPVKQCFDKEPFQRQLATPRNKHGSVFDACITPPLKSSDTASTIFSSNNYNQENASSPCHSHFTTTPSENKSEETEFVSWNEIIKDSPVPDISHTTSTTDALLDHSSITPSVHKTRRKNGEKVSTLPPGYIDQFISGPDVNKKYICNFKTCGKIFQRKYNIRSHIQTHLCDRPYECSFASCSKRFVRQHDLHRHEKIHQTNKFNCECGKSFSRVDALRRHVERNICIGGIESESSIKKPKKKRGRPRKVLSENPAIINKIEESLNNSADTSSGRKNDFSEVNDYAISSFVENSSYPISCMVTNRMTSSVPLRH